MLCLSRWGSNRAGAPATAVRPKEGFFMAEAKGATGYSRAIDDILSPNAIKVLQKRYLMKGEAGNPAEEPPLFLRRVAGHRLSAWRRSSGLRAG